MSLYASRCPENDPAYLDAIALDEGPEGPAPVALASPAAAPNIRWGDRSALEDAARRVAPRGADGLITAAVELGLLSVRRGTPGRVPTREAVALLTTGRRVRSRAGLRYASRRKLLARPERTAWHHLARLVEAGIGTTAGGTFTFAAAAWSAAFGCPDAHLAHQAHRSQLRRERNRQATRRLRAGRRLLQVLAVTPLQTSSDSAHLQGCHQDHQVHDSTPPPDAAASRPEPVPDQSKVACPTRPTGEHTVSDMSHPADNLPVSPPPAEDPTAQVPERTAGATTDVAGAPENPAPPPPLAELRAQAVPFAGTDATADIRADRDRVRGEPPPSDSAPPPGKPDAGSFMARVAARTAAACAERLAEEAARAAAAARKPAAPPPRQGAPGGAGPDPRATVPRRVAPPSRPPPPTPSRPASDGDWRRLSADHPWMRNCDRITVLASQATAEQLRQAVERTSEAMRKKPVANPTSYLAMVCRTLVAEAPRYAR